MLGRTFFNRSGVVAIGVICSLSVLGQVHAVPVVLFNATFDTGVIAEDSSGSPITPIDHSMKITSGGPAAWGESLDATEPGRMSWSTEGHVNFTAGCLSFDILADGGVGVTYPVHIGCDGVDTVGDTDGLTVLLIHQDDDQVLWKVIWNHSPDDISLVVPQTLSPNQMVHVEITWDMTGGAGAGVVDLALDGKRVAKGSGFDPIASPVTDKIEIGSIAGDSGGEIGGYIDNFQIVGEVPESASVGLVAICAVVLCQRRLT